MWTRKELKERGKASFKKNYWKCVLVGLIFSLLTGIISTGLRGGRGGGAVTFPTFTIPNSFGVDMPDIDMPDINIETGGTTEEAARDIEDIGDELAEEIAEDADDDDFDPDDFDFSGDGEFKYKGNEYSVNIEDNKIVITNSAGKEVVNVDGNTGKVLVDPDDELSKTIESSDDQITITDEDGYDVVNIDPGSFIDPAIILGLGIGIAALIGIMIIISIVISLIIFIISFAINVFFINPVEIGVKRFFRRNLEEPANISNITYGYDYNYKNVVKVMFFRDLYIFLWSLLFVIPGIIKGYEYRMVPYLLSENPNMSKDEAFAESKRLMDGQKWETFVLDLSFIGWYILGGLTFGILNIFFVTPYQQATNAALYEHLKYGRPAVETVQPEYTQAETVQPEYTQPEPSQPEFTEPESEVVTGEVVDEE